MGTEESPLDELMNEGLYALLRDELQRRQQGLQDAKFFLDALVGKRPSPDTRVKVSLTTQEREVIDEAARRAGVSRSEFMRMGSILFAGIIAKRTRHDG